MSCGLYVAPAELPRRSELVVFGDPPESFDAAEIETQWRDLEIVVPTAKGTRRRHIRAMTFDIASAISWLGPLPIGNDSPAVEAWSVATKLGLDLVARGRLLPVVTAGGHDSWKVGPLDRSDIDRLNELGNAMPPDAYALPMPDSSPTRLHSPTWLIREYWNAIADTMVRSAGAARTVSHDAFATTGEEMVDELRDWLAEGDSTSQVGSMRLGFRLEPPEGQVDQDDREYQQQGFSVVPYLQSTTDYSLSIDAAELWDTPPALLDRFGDDVEALLLRSLRQAAQAWRPLRALLDQERPDRLELNEVAVNDLLDTGSEQLRAFGFDVAWPKELTASSLSMRASVFTPNPGSSKQATFNLSQLLELKWQATLDGEQLTEEELKQLADAKRSLVRLRGRWVVIDHDTLERVRKRKARNTRPLQTGEALAAAMRGSVTLDGELFDIEVDSVIEGVVERVRNFTNTRELPEPAGLVATLRPYQRRGLAWLNEMCDLGLGGCLADDMGLGKTIQVIALHVHRGGGPMLVVCPASLLGNWEREINRFAPGVKVRRFHGSERNLQDVQGDEIVLATYGVVRRDTTTLRSVSWELVVADEAQHVKNPLSKTARALRTIPSNVRLALTGTPVENQLTELWSLLDWTTPGLLGNLEAFRRNVATPIERFRDEEATVALAKVVKPFILRRHKRDPDVAPELPLKTESDVIVTLTTEQASLYRAVTDEVLEQIRVRSGIERRGLVLKLLTSLKQICNHPAQFLKQPGPVPRRSGKLAAFDELIDGLEGTDESVLVFSQYVQMGRLLESHLAERKVSSLFLHGGVSPKRRDSMVQEFQNGEARVFLLSLKAGGTGLNLTRATHVIHYDRWWNPAVEDQATDRAYRIGQTQPVQVHRLVTEGTLEERIALMLAEKRNLSDAVIGTGEAWVSELTNDELSDLVSLGQSS